MARLKTIESYEPVKPRLRSVGRRAVPFRKPPAETSQIQKSDGRASRFPSKTSTVKRLTRNHTFAYAALFAFTLVLYARPYEFYPSPLTTSSALIFGIITLALFIPGQLAFEGNLTAPLPEVKYILLFALLGLASIPLAISPLDGWSTFSDIFIRCIVIFVVFVNVVRTEARLNGLLYLALAVGIWLSVGAINDYRTGLLTVEGYRVAGRSGGIFGNSNDMALFLVTMTPVAIAFLLRARNIGLKIGFALITLLMIAAIMVTYSRGGFLGLVTALAFLGWRLGNRHRMQILVGGFLLVIAFLVLAPGGYGVRLASIIFPSLDAKGSSQVRRGDLARSLYVALRHPILGIGMGNYASQMSYTGLVTHNSYTQVAAEMGLAALYCYTMFIVAPLRRLGQIARDSVGPKGNPKFHYLAIGLQASLIAYMVSSFFLSVAYVWYVYYLVGYAVCFRRIYESETGAPVVIRKHERTSKSEQTLPIRE